MSREDNPAAVVLPVFRRFDYVTGGCVQAGLLSRALRKQEKDCSRCRARLVYRDTRWDLVRDIGRGRNTRGK